MVDLAERQSVLYDRVSPRLAVFDDVGGIKEIGVTERADGTSALVGQHDSRSKRRLMKSLLADPFGISPLQQADLACQETRRSETLVFPDRHDKPTLAGLLGDEVDGHDRSENTGDDLLEPHQWYPEFVGAAQLLVIASTRIARSHRIAQESLRAGSVVVRRLLRCQDAQRCQEFGWVSDATALVQKGNSSTVEDKCLEIRPEHQSTVTLRERLDVGDRCLPDGQISILSKLPHVGSLTWLPCQRNQRDITPLVVSESRRLDRSRLIAIRGSPMVRSEDEVGCPGWLAGIRTLLKPRRRPVDYGCMIRRVSGGRLKLWQAAGQELRSLRRDLLGLLPIVVGFIVMMNLPWWPPYERGFMTGAFIVVLLWVVSWAVWVLSGLGFRVNGVMAEDATNEVCRKHPNALETLPSFKFPRFDIDTVLVTSAAVYAVETKWRSRPPTPDELERDATRLHRDLRAFREVLTDQQIPDEWVRGVLVVRGPGSKAVKPQLLEVDRGRGRVRVVNGADFPVWLDGQNRGMVGVDYADRLIRHLQMCNREREQEIEAGPILRWLARAR